MEENLKIDRVLEYKLGFDRVRKAISDRCNTEYATKRVDTESFTNDAKLIQQRLLVSEEMRLIMMFEEAFPTNGYIDFIDNLKILSKDGARIDLMSMGKLRTFLDTSKKIKIFFDNVKDSVYPNLKKISRHIRLYPELEDRINHIVDKFGNIKDTASDKLFTIRQDIKQKENSVSKLINSILKKAQSEGFTDSDASAVVRDGRLLIPVNSAFKRRIKGFVYDESASGKTSFIQPAELIDLENEINELHFEENREITRLLAEFSEFLHPFVPQLIIIAKIQGELDFLMAKALVSLEYIAGLPLISDNNEMNLRKARHPLLEKSLKKESKKIVPLSVRLNEDKHIVLISGPNAGGKSVCLKTVGLLQYMFQWGMLIPTSETSEMMIFDRIMVDIGDGQSIDNDLSTYSSFLYSMASMLEKADNKTLVLIDEFGSGTEPSAGGAIAEAILSEFDKRGVYGVITTHYTNLKLYASNKDTGVVNAAMQFDIKNIAPLFQLDIGLPGNSFAFQLARKMGLPEQIVKDAELRAGEELVGMEKNLAKIVRNKRVIDEKLQRIKQTDKTLESITNRYQKELEGIKQIKKDIIEEARAEALEIVKNANREVEHTIKTIKEAQAEKNKTNEARTNLRTFLDALSNKKEQDLREKEAYVDNKLKILEKRRQNKLGKKAKGSSQEDISKAQEQKHLEAFRTAALKQGEKVRIKSNGMVGEVYKVSNKSVTVIVGSISTKLALDKVERISSNEFKAATKDNAPKQTRQYEDKNITERKLNFKPEIDIRGYRMAEALDTVIKFIDDAIMLNMSSVRIVHGKGTGVLREEIQKFLKTIPAISSVKDEHLQFGGTGVTVVTFD